MKVKAIEKLEEGTKVLRMQDSETLPEDSDSTVKTPSKVSASEVETMRGLDELWITFSGKTDGKVYTGAVMVPGAKLFKKDPPLEHARVYFQGLLVSARSKRRSQLSDGKSPTVESDEDAISEKGASE